MKKEITISWGVRSFILILAGLLSAGLLHGLIFAVITINNLDFRGCNSIIDPLSIAEEWYYSSLILIIITSIVFVLLLFKRGSARLLSIGIILSVAYPVIIFLKVYPDYHNREKYFRKFDHSEWNKATYKSLPVARWLDLENSTRGKTESQVKDMLGNPTFSNDSTLRYELEFPGIYFEISFRDKIAGSDTIVCFL